MVIRIITGSKLEEIDVPKMSVFTGKNGKIREEE